MSRLQITNLFGWQCVAATYALDRWRLADIVVYCAALVSIAILIILLVSRSGSRSDPGNKCECANLKKNCDEGAMQ